jgi:small subunit ribosomal protein S2
LLAGAVLDGISAELGSSGADLGAAARPILEALPEPEPEHA